MRRLPAATVIALAAALGLAACEEEGAAEQAGEAIDESLDDAGDALEEAGEEAQSAE